MLAWAPPFDRQVIQLMPEEFADGEPRSVAAADEYIETKRQNIANNLHFACQVFANEYVRRLCRPMCTIVKPMRENAARTKSVARPPMAPWS